MSWACVVVILAACRFDPSGVAPELTTQPDGRTEIPDAPPASDGGADAAGGGGGGADAAADAAVPEGPPFCDPADPSLIGCYRFEIGEQTAQPFDESQHRNQGTSTGVTYGPGHDGTGSALITKPGSVVQISERAIFDVTRALTIELWIAPRVLPTVRGGLVDNDKQYGLFLTETGEIRCVVPPDGVTGPSVPLGTWTHLACVFDGANITLYLNGKFQASAKGPSSARTNGTKGLLIGSDGPGNELDGAIDQLRIWNVARTQPQICEAAGTCDDI